MEKDFEREQRALIGIKAIVDAYKKGSTKIAVGKGNFEEDKHTHDISLVMNYIQNYVCEGLGLPIPSTRKYERKE